MCLLAWAALGAGALQVPERAEITNFALGPDYAQWLVGPIFHIASKSEVREYLALAEDEEAAAFIDAFWKGRGSGPAWTETGPRGTFERRAAEADSLFSEGTALGRATDRGTTHVLYGEPLEKRFEFTAKSAGEPIEVWHYGKKAEVGLDGSRPKANYFFREIDSVTRFTSPHSRRRTRDPGGSLRPEEP